MNHSHNTQMTDMPVTDSPNQAQQSPAPLNEHVTQTLAHYFQTLEQETPTDVYQMVISQVEKPLLEYVLARTEFNQSRAAAILGINRNTLRKKMQHYQITQPS